MIYFPFNFTHTYDAAHDAAINLSDVSFFNYSNILLVREVLFVVDFMLLFFSFNFKDFLCKTILKF